MKMRVLKRVIPARHLYPDPRTKDAQRPKSVEVYQQQSVGPTGHYILVHKKEQMKTNFYLILVIFLLVFFLLFRVWPEWLRLYMYYASWYMLEFLIGAAIVRLIVWFLLFHVGIDFWIFPNYFCDSNNPLDALWPLLGVEMRADKFDPMMTCVRVVSAFLIVHSSNEFLKDPKNLDELLGGGAEIMNDMYEWGHDRFMGIP
jgi:hypothetical protein